MAKVAAGQGGLALPGFGQHRQGWCGGSLRPVRLREAVPFGTCCLLAVTDLVPSPEVVLIIVMLATD